MISVINGDNWQRNREKEGGKIHRFWEHEDGRELRVEQYRDGTWDALADESLLENYDSPEEAVERLKDHVSE